jgi:hypothetical protein
MGSCSSSHESHTQFLVTVTDAISPRLGGCIHCAVYNESPPVKYEWYNEDGSTALLELSDDRSTATNVPPGRYKISARDTRVCVTRTVDVITISVPTIVNYKVTHASSDTARDGKIVAQIENGDESHILWTSGVITNDSSLYDVAPGTYTASPLTQKPFIHACPPAVVLATRARARIEGLNNES